MTIKSLFDIAIKNNFIDLQALIMFLVFEKKVLTMEQDSKKLDLYFLEQHSERMNHELRLYKRTMNMRYGMNVYKFDDRFYILANSVDQAKFIANRNNIPIEKVKIANMDKLMHYNNSDIVLRDLARGKPRYLGGF